MAIAGNANTTNVYKAKFEWNDDETLLYITIISTGGIVGLAIGSFLGGALIKFGRCKAAVIANLFAIVSAGICMIGSVEFLTIGRVFLGIASGISNVIFGKMITENLPQKYISKFSMVHNVNICVEILVKFLMGAFLPDSDDS